MGPRMRGGDEEESTATLCLVCATSGALPGNSEFRTLVETGWGTERLVQGFQIRDQQTGADEMLGTILLIILILLLIGALPTWGYSGGWGYYPSGGVGLLLVIVVVLLLVGRI
jgi:hypothetical protein